jgi:hypothetical protein
MAIPPTDIRILFTNYDIITYFLNLVSCSEYFISIKHRILAIFNINKKIKFWQPVCLSDITPYLFLDTATRLQWPVTQLAGSSSFF